MFVVLAAVVSATALVYALHAWAVRDRTFPRDIPWVGKHTQLFAILRANWRDWFLAKQTIEEGYKQYSKKNIPFISPTYHRHPEVILPREYLKWLVDQPDDVVSIGTVLQEDLHFPYTSPGSWAFAHAYHVEALNKMRLDPLTPGILDEIETSIDTLWGIDCSTGSDVGVWSTVSETLIAITNRAIVGAPLCHDPSYHAWTREFIRRLGHQSMKISLFVPVVLRPVLAPWLARPCRQADEQCARHLRPLVSERLRTADQARIDPGFEREDRNDLLDWTVKLAAKSSDPRDRDPVDICSRLLSLSFVGVHTSLMTMTNALLDLASAPPSVVAILRDEAERVYTEVDGIWSKAAVAKLILMDSFFRESLRLRVFKARGIERQVIAPQGLTLPNGTHLPKGTRLGMPTLGIQHDEDLYIDAGSFKPFRFVSDEKNMAMVNTGDTFLAFGHGRHACPGRFFAAHELKLLLAYIVINYEIEHLDSRPQNNWGADFCVPTDTASIRVRRRPR